jgi:transcriptional regulator with XRE-family HTH domain
MTRYLAAEVGQNELILSIRALSAYENGKIAPSIYKLWALALVYGKPVSLLLSWYDIDQSRGNKATAALWKDSSI